MACPAAIFVLMAVPRLAQLECHFTDISIIFLESEHHIVKWYCCQNFDFTHCRILVCITVVIASVLQHCWFGDKKGIQPVKLSASQLSLIRGGEKSNAQHTNPDLPRKCP